MVSPKRRVVWDNFAKLQLKQACQYIDQDSPQNARKVGSDIIAITQKLASHPEKHSIDKYKLNNDGSYRAFEKHRYRIVYRVLKDEIRILRLRHTSMEPINY